MDVAQRKAPLTTGPLQVRDLDDCRNSQKGSVLIIASGASAKDFPLHKYADVPMITMNGAISKFIGTGISPFFYVCTDQGFSEQQPELFTRAMHLSERVALWENHIWHTSFKPQGDLYFLRRAPRLSWRDLFRTDKELVRNRKIGNGRNKTLGFSKNLKRGFFDARTVAYLAIQLAYHLGFTKVFLVGVDLDPSVSRFYETPGTFISPCVLDDHFQTRILPSFAILAKSVVNADFRVYNVSHTSKIPVELVPRVTLDELERLI
ncbi:lipopolysaccharide biosynthesis protein [Pseudomonas sp. MAG733B]|uniref:lipopolysaccharide biosynthesis protein n=1 Tax=Pseudomonas sp. MAG733B TaxID=3122079 RepID=UPI0030D17167